MSPRLSPFLLPLALFLGLAFYQLALPGPNYDEAVEAKAAVQIMAGLPVEAHRDAVAHVWGVRLPLMIVDYVGALNTYALLLLFKLGGVSVLTLRLWPIIVAVAILWLTHRLALLLAGPRAALLSALILAVHPSFLFFARQGIYVTNTTIAFMLAILLALWRLVESGRLRWWYGAAFLAGLGLWAKFIMLWPLAALIMLAPLVWWGRRWFGVQAVAGFSPRGLARPQALLGGGVLFLLGLSPLLLFNLQTGATLQHFLGALGRSYYGVENLDYGQNLARRWAQIGDFLRGDHFWYLGGNFEDALARPAWLLSLPLLLGLLLWRRRQPDQVAVALRGLFFYAFFLLLLLQTPLTPTALWYTHLALFSPILALPVALAAELLARQTRRPWLPAALIAVALVASSLTADVRYHRGLAASGGYADHSDAAYRLAAALQEGGMTDPYALDWGFDAPLILLTRGQVNPIEIFGYDRFDAPDAGFDDRVRPLLHDPANIFLLHAADRTNFPGRREALYALAAAEGVTLHTVVAISERSGALHTEIVQAQ